MSSNYYDLHFEDNFLGIPIINKHAPYVTGYLESIKKVLDRSVQDSKRLSVMRFCLRLPKHSNLDANYERQLMSVFFRSLRAQLDNADIRKTRKSSNKRTYSHRMRYVWVRERSSSENYHYHCAIFINRDDYKSLGDIDYVYSKIDENGVPPDALLGYIYTAWMRTLGLSFDQKRGLIHVPHNHAYKIDVHDNSDFMRAYFDAFRRLSYLAKLSTKDYSDDFRNFGCSIR